VDKYIKSNICPLPWTHLEVDVNGGASPCCLYKGSVPDVKVYEQSLKAYKTVSICRTYVSSFVKVNVLKVVRVVGRKKMRAKHQRDRIPYTK
jgi:hypothetical protein